MKKIILQYSTPSIKPILDVVMPTNQAYAAKFGFEYITDSTQRITDGRDSCWEKIAYLNAFLPTVEDGSLVVWEDADSLNIGNEDIESALPTNGILGMVPLRGGLNRTSIMDWYNSGVIVIVNSPVIRDFFTSVWNRGGQFDEDGIMGELRHRGGFITNGIGISAIDPKWNCWRNNAMFCKDPIIQTFHGMKTELKLEAIQVALGLKPDSTAIQAALGLNLDTTVRAQPTITETPEKTVPKKSFFRRGFRRGFRS